MAIPVSEEQKFMSFSLAGAPTSSDGHALVDLWIKLPATGKFILYVPRGERVTDKHVEKISKHSNKNVFVLAADFLRPENSDTEVTKSSGSTPTLEPLQDLKQIFKNESTQTDLTKLIEGLGREAAHTVSNKPLTHELRRIYNDLLSPSELGEVSLEDSNISFIATRVLDVVAPEVNAIRKNLSTSTQLIGTMNDSAVMTAIVIYFAMATGQSSPAVFRDFAYACLLMDLSLFEIPRKDIEKHLLNPKSVPVSVAEKIEAHPARSCEIIEKKFRNISSSVRQMIRGHHELFSGRGYPNRVRSEINAPVVKTLALAVDVFETMKRAQLRREQMSLDRALEEVGFRTEAAHLRRHSFALCREIRSFMKSTTLAA